MKICVVGSGYVGLVSATGFAETGQDVLCADIDASKIELLNKGEIPIYEPGLQTMVERNREAGRLRFTNDVASAVRGAQIVFVAVGTPSRDDGGANLSAVDAVAELIASQAQNELCLVLKSTVPVGTNARVRRITKDAKHPIHVISNPEFLKEGDAINDFLKPDRIVVGCDPSDDYAKEAMKRLYHPVTIIEERIVWMNPESAELTKYVANTMLAMRISFMNEVAMLCEKVGADVNSVRVGVGSDTRIGRKFLYAGPGYGGSCFPKDVKALVHTGHEHDIELELASATDRVNERHKGVLFRKVRAFFDGDVRGRTIGVWGLTFKPQTDDIRESPAVRLVDALLADGATVKAHDPEGVDNAKKVFRDQVEFTTDMYECARDADALILVTEWRQYLYPDFDRLKDMLAGNALIDGRNIWGVYKLHERGFAYSGIGTL